MPQKPNIIEKKRSENQVVTVQSAKFESYSGLIPHPALIEHYERILPGSAHRILALTEKQSSHRIEIENLVISSQQRNQFTGQLIGFFIASLSIFASVYLAVNNHEMTACILGSSTVFVLAAAYIAGKYFQHKDLQKKKQNRIVVE